MKVASRLHVTSTSPPLHNKVLPVPSTMSVKPCKWRDLKPINITSRPAPGKAIFQSATQRNPALSVIKMAVSDDIKYVQAEAELLDIKVKAVEGLLRPSHKGPKMFHAHIDIEPLKLEIGELSRCSDKLFHLAHNLQKSLGWTTSCFPEAQDLSQRVAALRTILMSIKTSSGK
jgi:hypothetical protein